MSNFQSNQYLSAANIPSLDAIQSLNRAVFEGMEKMASLNFEITREALNTGSEHIQALLSSNSPQEATALQSSLGKAAVEKSSAYSRNVWEISTRLANEIGCLLQLQFEELTKVSQEIVQKTAKNTPFSSDVTQAFVKQTNQLSEGYLTTISTMLNPIGAKAKR